MEFTTPLTELAMEAWRARAELETATQRHTAAQLALSGAMEAAGRKTKTIRARDGSRFKLTYVAAERVVFNEDGLRKAVGAPAFRKLCAKPRLDRAKVDEAVRNGALDADVLASFVSIETNKPNVKITPLEGDDEE